MNKRINRINTIANLAAIGLAILIGFLLPKLATSIEFFGKWYIDSLKVIISPIIFLSMSIFVLKRDTTKKFLIGKTVLLFVIMFLTTFLLTSLIVAIVKPGVGFIGQLYEEQVAEADFSFKNIIGKLIPCKLDSLKDLFYGGFIFFIIVLALLISFIISKTKIKEKYTKGLEFCKGYLDKALKIVITLTPLAVLSLVSNMIVKNQGATFKTIGVYLLCAYLISIVVIILVMILPVWLIAKVNPITYIKKVSKVWLITVTTQSSVATLPHTIRVCNEDFGVNEKITDVVVPLGCTIHMCGGAVSFALLGIFVAQMNGITITLPMFLLMILFSTLVNMAAPGVPGGGKVIGPTYLTFLGLGYETFIGLYIGFYSFLDMCYTTLNVTGDISANILLDHYERRVKKEDNVTGDKND